MSQERSRRGSPRVGLESYPHPRVGAIAGEGKWVFLGQAVTFLIRRPSPDRLWLAPLDLEGGANFTDSSYLAHALFHVADVVSGGGDDQPRPEGIGPAAC
ncbi:MAG: hypothetical protein HKL89_07560 [Candidatus Dormibacteraeota bacterium]|nr:hypothetical protein [Candidatus Dormibacteraeota bacterium]